MAYMGAVRVDPSAAYPGCQPLIHWPRYKTLVHPMQQWPEGAHVEEMAALAAVAEQGSFAKAAESLQRDATVLTRRIQSLERRLGVRLLERTTRRVTLTEAGARFLALTQDAWAVF